MLLRIFVDLIFNSFIVLYILLSPIFIALIMALLSLPENVYLFVTLNSVAVLLPFLKN